MAIQSIIQHQFDTYEAAVAFVTAAMNSAKDGPGQVRLSLSGFTDEPSTHLPGSWYVRIEGESEAMARVEMPG